MTSRYTCCKKVSAEQDPDYQSRSQGGYVSLKSASASQMLRFRGITKTELPELSHNLHVRLVSTMEVVTIYKGQVRVRFRVLKH